VSETKAPFEHWALVELFGHQRIAGKVTESEIGGGKFLRVDVPAVGDRQALTKYYGPSAIYGITPVTEETALALAQRIDAAPVTAWDARSLLAEKSPQRLSAGEHPHDDQDEFEDQN
jgi:hypothetical protein